MAIEGESYIYISEDDNLRPTQAHLGVVDGWANTPKTVVLTCYSRHWQLDSEVKFSGPAFSIVICVDAASNTPAYVTLTCLRKIRTHPASLGHYSNNHI